MDVQTAVNSLRAEVGVQLNDPLDYVGECVGECNWYVRKLGKRPFSGNANQWAGQNHDQWTWHVNTSTAVPTSGSIMCFAPNVNTTTVKTGPDAHVDVYDSGNVNSWNGLDQNWGGVQKVQEIHHGNYAGVMGWLTPIEAAPTPPPAPVTGVARVLRACNVRTAPSVNAQVTSVLQPGNTFDYQNKVIGDSVNGNNVWYHSTLGHFVWSGNCEG